MFLLLFTSRGRDFFVMSDPKPDADEPVGQGTGFSARVLKKVQAAYETLRQKFDYQENVCANLRHVSGLTLVYPEAINEEEADKKFRGFLDRRQYRHRKWMWIDMAVAGAASLLTPIPGPNVFFLYPAARALSHFFAARGIVKARQLQVLSYERNSAIDIIQNDLKSLDRVDQTIQSLESRYSLSRLRVLLEKI